MKRILVLTFVAAMTLWAADRLGAQQTPPPAAQLGQPGQPGQPPPFRGPPPNFRRGPQRGAYLYTRGLADLHMIKMELQRSKTDLGGHRDSAVDAVDRAIAELEAVRAYEQTNAVHMPPPGQGAGQPVPQAAPAAPAAPPAAPQQ